MDTFDPRREGLVEPIGRELFANTMRRRVALLLASADPSAQFAAVELARELGVGEGAVLRELVALAALGMIEPGPQRGGAWTLVVHPLWRVIAATDDALDEATRASSAQRLRLLLPDRPPEPA